MVMMKEDREHLTTSIAVIGMAGRFPGAADLDSYWRNLRDGIISISHFSEQELLDAGVEPAVAADPNFVPAAGLIEVADEFDADFFGCSPRESTFMDPQQRWFLQCSWEALESAGYDPFRYQGLVGVYGGATTSSYQFGLYSHPELGGPANGLSIAMGNDLSFLTTRVSHKLDLRGPSCPVQTACSTSLVAIHLACQALLNAECDMAIAGAASIRVPIRQGYVYQEGGILCPDGVCRPFDAKAQGTLFGNGVGVVVLKRLQDALDDGDSIDAVIRGSAINNDGAHKASFTAPSVAGQSDVICSALAAADVDPQSIRFVETHGTGTLLGDSIEVQALRDAYAGRTLKEPFCAIGSVKANIGHLDAAAGIASFIKTVLALRERTLPPTPNFQQPNPDLHLEATPFRVQTKREPWDPGETPRRAGISSFGFGGTNAHVIVEEAPPLQSSPAARLTQCLPLSANRADALATVAARLAAHLAKYPGTQLADAAYTLQVGRRACRYRRAIVCRDTADAVQQLQGDSLRHVIKGSSDVESREVVLLLHSNLSADVAYSQKLFENESVFRDAILRCERTVLHATSISLVDHLLRPGPYAVEAGTNASPMLDRIACFATQWGLAQLWFDWGIRPAAYLAHGVGEFVAACLSGMWECEDALRPLLCNIESESADPHSMPSEFNSAVKHLSTASNSTPWFSCARQDWIDSFVNDQTAPARWYRALRGSCSVERGTQIFSRRSDSLFLELGHESELAVSLRGKLPADKVHPVVSSCEVGQSHPLLSALGRLWVQGVPVDWSSLHKGERRRRVSLPTYPFDSARHWFNSSIVREGESTPQARGTTDREPDVGQWFYVPDWHREPLPPRRNQVADRVQRQHFILFLDAHGLGERLGQRLVDLGQVVTMVQRSAPNERYENLGSGRFRVRALQHDYERLFGDVSESALPLQVIYLWGLTYEDATSENDNSIEVALAESESEFLSLLCLARALAGLSAEAASTMCILGGPHQEVAGDESCTANGAEIAGLTKVIPQEYPGVFCRMIDIDRHTINDALGADSGCSDLLAEDLIRRPTSDLVAYRHARRWKQRFRHCPLPPVDHLPARVRNGGFYWITGGLGSMGQAIARYLAKDVQARILLTSKSGLPAEDSWDDVLAHGLPDDVNVQRIEFVRELRQLGAELMVVAADVSNANQMKAALEGAESRWGKLDGVIHAAGLIRGNAFQPLSETGCEIVRRHFAAKIVGLRVINGLLEDRELDFCLLASSLSSILGGLRYGAYAAANSFMDSFAQARDRTSAANWISVNWDRWLSVDEEAAPASGVEAQRFCVELERGDRCPQASSRPQTRSASDRFNRRLARTFANMDRSGK